jgi:hypothetical protein
MAAASGVLLALAAALAFLPAFPAGPSALLTALLPSALTTLFAHFALLPSAPSQSSRQGTEGFTRTASALVDRRAAPGWAALARPGRGASPDRRPARAELGVAGRCSSRDPDQHAAECEPGRRDRGGHVVRMPRAGRSSVAPRSDAGRTTVARRGESRSTLWSESARFRVRSDRNLVRLSTERNVTEAKPLHSCFPLSVRMP